MEGSDVPRETMAAIEIARTQAFKLLLRAPHRASLYAKTDENIPLKLRTIHICESEGH